MTWNERLKQAFDAAAIKRRINQTDLANASGVEPASVSDWFNGETKSIKSACLLRACKFLEVSPYWVVLGEDDPKPEFAPLITSEQISISASDTIRLISAYAQTNDDGRTRILEIAEKTKKSFPRS